MIPTSFSRPMALLRTSIRRARCTFRSWSRTPSVSWRECLLCILTVCSRDLCPLHLVLFPLQLLHCYVLSVSNNDRMYQSKETGIVLSHRIVVDTVSWRGVTEQCYERLGPPTARLKCSHCFVYAGLENSRRPPTINLFCANWTV